MGLRVTSAMTSLASFFVCKRGFYKPCEVSSLSHRYALSHLQPHTLQQQA